MAAENYADKFLDNEYVIESAASKPDSHPNKWHNEIRGKHCSIYYLKEGYGAILMVDVDYDTCRHHFYTTEVIHIAVDESGNVEFETKNTFYKLALCENKEGGDTL